jgi:hypothetical protein
MGLWGVRIALQKPPLSATGFDSAQGRAHSPRGSANPNDAKHWCTWSAVAADVATIAVVACAFAYTIGVAAPTNST